MAKPVVAGDRFSGRPAGSLRTGPSHHHPLNYPAESVTYPPGLNCYPSSRSYQGQRRDERKRMEAMR